LKLENLELFDPVAQEQHRLSPARIITPSKRTKSTNGSRLTKRTKNDSAAMKNCARKNLILREWESSPRLQSMMESRQGTSRLKGRREKSILGGRTKTVEENHWPKNKAGEMTCVMLAGSTGIDMSEKQDSGLRGCRPMRISPRKRERVVRKSKTGKTCPRAGTRARTRSEDRAAGSELEVDREVQARAHVLLANASAH
jgi:hypothetical protein